MTIQAYQKAAASFGCYKDPIYPLMGLAEEAGEAIGKVAKHIRANGKLNSDAPDAPFVPALKKELGDCLWMIAETCTIYGLDLEEVMAENIAKLKDRKERGVLCGEGDNR